MAVVCKKIAHSDQSLEKICASKKYLPSPALIMKWVLETPSLADLYAHAKERQADYLAEQIIEISDSEPNPKKAKVRIDARIWAASKLNSRKYGDKLELNGSLETTNNDLHSLENALAIGAILERIKQRAVVDNPAAVEDNKPAQILHVVVPITKP